MTCKHHFIIFKTKGEVKKKKAKYLCQRICIFQSSLCNLISQNWNEMKIIASLYLFLPKSRIIFELYKTKAKYINNRRIACGILRCYLGTR